MFVEYIPDKQLLEVRGGQEHVSDNGELGGERGEAGACGGDRGGDQKEQKIIMIIHSKNLTSLLHLRLPQVLLEKFVLQ